MAAQIHLVPMGIDSGYLVRDQGTVMIDGGQPGKACAFLKAAEKASIKPEEVQLIILTHGHWDHIGSAKEIKELSGAKIAMHQLERDCLEKSQELIPPGASRWGRILIKFLSLYIHTTHIPETEVDIPLGDEEFSLSAYGIPGTIIHTPGHSWGSVSVLLETGDAFVGDLAMNMVPLRSSPGLPVFAEDLETVKSSWRKLLEKGVKTVYPAHGKPFPVDIISKSLS